MIHRTPTYPRLISLGPAGKPPPLLPEQLECVPISSNLARAGLKKKVGVTNEVVRTPKGLVAPPASETGRKTSELITAGAWSPLPGLQPSVEKTEVTIEGENERGRERDGLTGLVTS